MNLYAIKILEKTIGEHLAEIKKLENSESEMVCEMMFKDEEIVERKEYIKQLQQAVDKLK